MNNKITHLLQIGKTLAVIAGALIGLAYGASALAAEMAGGTAIDFQNGSGPLFDFTGFMPGDSAISWVRARNLEAAEKNITVWAENAVNTDKLGDVMDLTIKKGGTVLYHDSLSDFLNVGHVNLSTLGALETAAYDFNLQFDLLAGNVYQGTNVSFDLAINVSDDNGGDDDTSDDDTSDDDTSDDDTSDDDTTTDDDTSDDDTSDDTSPVRRHSSGSTGGGVIALVITNVRAENITADSASIKWDTNLDATSQVIYSPVGGGHDFDPSAPARYGYDILYPSSEGRDFVLDHTVDLNSLKECSLYYFRVISRATAPAPSISEEHWFATACPDTGNAGNGGSASRREVLGVSTAAQIGAADEFNKDQGIGKEGSQNNKGVAPLAPGSLWDAPGGLGGIAGFDTCAPDVPWWLFLVFAAYPISKSRSRLNQAKKTIDLTLKKFFTASSRAWLYSSLLPLGLALWAFLAHRCLPWWPLVALLVATIVGCEYDRRKAAQAIGRSGIRNTQPIDSSLAREKPSATL